MGIQKVSIIKEKRNTGRPWVVRWYGEFNFDTGEKPRFAKSFRTKKEAEFFAIEKNIEIGYGYENKKNQKIDVLKIRLLRLTDEEIEKLYYVSQDMRVHLCKKKIEKHHKVYIYWVLRWFGSNGQHQYSQHIGRVNGLRKISKRQAEIIKSHKEQELKEQIFGEYLKILGKDNPIYEYYKEKEKAEQKEKDKSEGGYIYILKSAGLYKLGISRKPKKQRFKRYTTENPFGFEVIFCEKCKHYDQKEKVLIQTFRHKRKAGREWFNFTLEDIEKIKRFILNDEPLCIYRPYA